MITPLVLALALSQPASAASDAPAAPATPPPAESAAPTAAPAAAEPVAAPTEPVDAGAPVAEAVAAPVTPDAGVDTEDLERRRTTVITASRTERKLDEVVVPTEVITRVQIEQQGARDLTQLLEQHPGVELVYTNRGTGIRLQGLDPEYVLVLVDGQRVAGRSGSIVDLSRFSLRDVERVEITKGPAAALYGADAIGGVINLITRRPTKPLEASVRAAGGMLSNAATSSGTGTEADVRGNVGSKLGDFDLRLGGGYRTRDAFDWAPRKADGTPDVATSGPKLLREDVDLEAGWTPSEKVKAFARGSYVFTDMTGVDINDQGAIFDRYQRTDQADAWAGVKAALGDSTNLTARGHFGYFRDQFMLDQRGSRALDDYTMNITRLSEGLLQADQKLGAEHQLTGGAEYLVENLSSTRINPTYVRRDRVGLFVQDTWTTAFGATRVTVEPGVRYDYDTQFKGAFSPRVAAKVDPLPSLTVRGSWGWGFRPPNFSELYLQFANPGIGYIVQGNPALQPERSNSFNLSVDWRPPLDGWLVSASAWRTDTQNLINITANTLPNPDAPTTFNYENVSAAYTQGVELSGRAKLSRGTWLELGGMFLDARDVTRNRALEGRSPVKATAQLTSKYRPLSLEFFVRGSWSSPRPYYAGNGLGFANVLATGPLAGSDQVILAPAYVDLEAQVAWAVKSWIKVFVNGHNLLNAGDQNFNPRPPRGVMAGVQVDY